MALISCSECGQRISDRAVFCPGCGFRRAGGFYCFEYRSKATMFGLPVVHIVLGPALDPASGQLRIAKGIIAIGGIAVGLLSMGGVSFGLISLGGLALGLAAIGGCAIGLFLAIGGLAIGLIAIGGAAFGYYALGGGCWGVENLGGGNPVLGFLSHSVGAAVSCVLRIFGY